MVLCGGVSALVLAFGRIKSGQVASFVRADWFLENGKPLEDEVVDRANTLYEIIIAVCGRPSQHFHNTLSTKNGVVDETTATLLTNSWETGLLSLVLALSYVFAVGMGQRPQNKQKDTIFAISEMEGGAKIAKRMINFVETFYCHINPCIQDPITRQEYQGKHILDGYIWVTRGRAKKNGLYSDCWFGEERNYFCQERRERVWFPFFLALSMCVGGVTDHKFVSDGKAPVPTDGISPEERDILESLVSPKARYPSIQLF